MEIKSKNKSTFLFATLFIALSACLTNIHRFYRNNTDLELQDWLINYQAGFVRRGLSGELFLILSNIFNTEVKFFYLFFLFIILISFFYLVFIFLKSINFTFLNIIIIFCPLSIFYNVFDAKSTGRKEILVLLLFLVFLNFIEKFKKKENLIIPLAIITPLLLLMHESILFFLPYFFIVMLIFVKKEDEIKFYIYSTAYWILILFITFILSKSGASLNQVHIICNSLQTSVKDICSQSGAIFYLTRDLDISFNDVINRNIIGIWKGFLSITIIAFIIGFLPIIFASVFFYKKNPKYKNNFIINNIDFKILLFLPLLFTLPLYFLTLDWGRWLHTSYTLTMFSFIFFIKKEFIYFNDSIAITKKIQTILSKKLRQILTFIIIIIYCLGWYLPYCCNTNIESPIFKTYKKINRVLNNFD